MSQLQPLRPRDQHTDEEWEMVSAGRCPAMTRGLRRLCGKPSDPRNSYRFCTKHHEAQVERMTPWQGWPA